MLNLNTNKLISHRSYVDYVYSSDMCVPSSSKIEVFEGARNNLPDADSHHAAMAVLDLTKGLHDTDILIVLISGNV